MSGVRMVVGGWWISPGADSCSHFAITQREIATPNRISPHGKFDFLLAVCEFEDAMCH